MMMVQFMNLMITLNLVIALKYIMILEKGEGIWIDFGFGGVYLERGGAILSE